MHAGIVKTALQIKAECLMRTLGDPRVYRCKTVGDKLRIFKRLRTRKPGLF